MKPVLQQEKFMSGGVNSVKSLLTLPLFILGNVQMSGINF